jgi:transposase
LVRWIGKREFFKVPKDPAEQKGYDAGKKVSGINRHIGVDTNGFPHMIEVTTANITDRKGALKAVEKNKENLSQIKAVLVDSNYTGKPFADGIKKILNTETQIAKRSELHKFIVIPKRWIVERSFAWLEKYRRNWKNCERKLNTSKQFVVLSFISILLKRF